MGESGRVSTKKSIAPVYRERIDKLQSEVGELENEVGKIRLQQKVAEMSSNCGEYVYKHIVLGISNFEKLSLEEKKTSFQRLIREMIIYEDHLEIKMLIGEDLKAPLPEHSLQKERPDGEVEASNKNDLCDGSTSHQRWLPRLDSNQDYKSQSLASYQLDDRAVNFSKSSCQKSLEQKILLRPYGHEKIFPISWR